MMYCPSCLGVQTTVIFLIIVISLPNTAIRQLVSIYLSTLAVENELVHTVAVICFTVAIFIFQFFTFTSGIISELVLIFCSTGLLKNTFNSAGIELQPAFKVYSSAAIFWNLFNQFGSISIAAGVFLQIPANACALFLVISYYSILPTPVILLLAAYNLAVFTLGSSIIAFAYYIVNDGNEFLHFWGQHLCRRYDRMRLRARVPIQTKIGKFFTLTSSTVLSVLAQTIDLVVTLLLVWLSTTFNNGKCLFSKQKDFISCSKYVERTSLSLFIRFIYYCEWIQKNMFHRGRCLVYLAKPEWMSLLGSLHITIFM